MMLTGGTHEVSGSIPAQLNNNILTLSAKLINFPHNALFPKVASHVCRCASVMEEGPVMGEFQLMKMITYYEY